VIVPSVETIQRTLDCEVAYTLSRLQVLERIEGNPVGVAHCRAGQNGWALAARHLPVPSFNAVIGLRAGDADALESLIEWYRNNGAKPQIEIVPGFEDAALMRELSRLGFHQSRFHVSMIARPQDAPAPAPAIDIVRVTDDGSFEKFLDAYVAGWQLSETERFRRNVRPWPSLPGWTMFFARIDGQPAAAATVYVLKDFAYLADAATDPRYRGRGLQSALLACRMRLAAECGAEYVCSGASFLSASHRNMVRAGMTLQFVRAIWTQV